MLQWHHLCLNRWESWKFLSFVIFLKNNKCMMLCIYSAFSHPYFCGLLPSQTKKMIYVVKFLPLWALSLTFLFQVESSDLIAYGLIPEFVGRFPILVSLTALTEDQLVKVNTLFTIWLTRFSVLLFFLWELWEHDWTRIVGAFHAES